MKRNRIIYYIGIIFYLSILLNSSISRSLAAGIALPSPPDPHGNQSKISLTVSNLNVLKALSLLFNIAHLQFVPDSGISGAVTFTLINQPFSVALNAICKQDYLRYTVDNRGIYHISWDDSALKKEFAHLRIMNGMLAQRLSGGGFNGQGSGYNNSAMQPYSLRNLAAAPAPSLSPLPSRARVLEANGLVTMEIPVGHPLPVAEVLHRFSLQSGVTILVDPIISQNNKFTIEGNLTAPLPEALSLLGAMAHLSIIQRNNDYFITTAPDFQIFYGDSPAPKVVYPGKTGAQQK